MTHHHNKRASKAMAFLACSFCITPALSVSAYAATDGDNVITTLPAPRPHITMLSFSVQEEARAVADTLSVYFSAHVESASAITAQQHLNQHINDATTLLKNYKNITCLTSDYSVREEYAPKNQKVWAARQSIILSGADKNTLLEASEKLQKLGLSIDNMQWSLAPATRQKLEEQARLGALKKIRLQAEEDARALGLSLIGLEKVHIGSDPIPDDLPSAPHPTLLFAESRMTTPPQSSAEEQSVSVHVSAQARLSAEETSIP